MSYERYCKARISRQKPATTRLTFGLIFKPRPQRPHLLSQPPAGRVLRAGQLVRHRHMSKSRALAGLRVGYAIGDADLIEGLTRVKDSFNSYPLGRPAQAGAIASLEDEAYFQQSRARVIEGRERLHRGLIRLGFEVLPSSANFVFARHPAHEGAALAIALRQRAVIVRHFSAPRIADYLRITVGTDEQTDRLLSALSEILGSNK